MPILEGYDGCGGIWYVLTNFLSFVFASCMAGTFHWCGCRDGGKWFVIDELFFILNQICMAEWHIVTLVTVLLVQFQGWIFMDERFNGETGFHLPRVDLSLDYRVFLVFFRISCVMLCILVFYLRFFLMRSTGAWSVPGTQRKQCEGRVRLTDLPPYGILGFWELLLIIVSDDVIAGIS